MKMPYTLCFLLRDDEVLLLFRNREPNKHRWNGVGGKIRPGETPRLSCLREIREETGLTAAQLEFRGILTWNEEAGLYLFTASAPEGEVRSGDEGQLAWKPLEWALQSPEVVSNLPYFLPVMLRSSVPREYAFTYNDAGDIIAFSQRPLPPGVDPDQPVDEALLIGT